MQTLGKNCMEDPSTLIEETTQWILLNRKL